MTQTLHYLQTKNIIHRDIKLENFMITQLDNFFKIQLIDFGFAVVIKENEKLTERVGSLNYIAPEVLLEKPYDYKADIFSVGVVLYNLLSGKQPFSGEDENEVAEKIIKSEVHFDYEVFNHVSTECKNLIRSLLSKDPEDRPSAYEAMNNNWVINKLKKHQ